MYDKDFYFFSFLSFISVLYFIEADSWLNPKGLSPGGGLPLVFAVEDFTVFRQIVFDIFFCIQHKSIFNRMSDSNTTMPHLRK